MLVEITGVSQEMELTSGASLNIISMLLPDGTLYRLPVEEALVAHIIGLFVSQGGAAAERASVESTAVLQTRPAQARQPTERAVAGDYAAHTVESQNEEFGGDYGPADSDGEDERPGGDWEVASTPSVGLAQDRPGPALQVQADAKGNPVIHGQNVVDQNTLLGGRGGEMEDDGVGSI